MYAGELTIDKRGGVGKNSTYFNRREKPDNAPELADACEEYVAVKLNMRNCGSF